MTPERLAEIEVHLRRHPTSPNTVGLALEVVEELRLRLEVDRVRSASVGQISEAPEPLPPAQKPPVSRPPTDPPCSAESETRPLLLNSAPDVAPTPPASPARKGKR